MLTAPYSREEVVGRLLSLPRSMGLCLIDSCGRRPPESDLLIAGIQPAIAIERSFNDPEEGLRFLDHHLTAARGIKFFTLSYEFGAGLHGIRPAAGTPAVAEPHIFVAAFDCVLVCDGPNGEVVLLGDAEACEKAMEEIAAVPVHALREPGAALARSNLSREGYMRAVERIRRLIKAGETYQTNLTQRITVQLLSPQDAADVYGRLRRDNPAPFSALLRRASSDVVSASPELFFTAEANGKIRVSPIKGTRPRGETPAEDDALEAELASSEKDRSENIMIVDLLRNDLGRICEFGSINVDSLCRVERHPTVLQMVSDVSGTLRPSETPSSIVRALFPCGSITGAPKRRTMEIISRIEPHRRGISMGAMGISIPPGYGIETRLECSVAIRTMAIAGSTAVFNAGGGIVYDSEPEAEYDESLLKAAALLRSLGAELA